MTTPTLFSSPPPAPDDLPELMPELADVSEILASGSYLVMRPGPTSVSHGVVVGGTPSYFWAVGSLTPASGQAIQRLPEGLRAREAKSFITPLELRGIDGETAPDQLTIDGVQFEVSNVSEWQQLAGYTQVTLTKVPS